MMQKVVHGAGPWGWDTVPRSDLVALACMSPHSCEVLGCPGPENKRKLEAFNELLERVMESKGWLESSLSAFNPLTARDNVTKAREILRAAIAKAKGI